MPQKHNVLVGFANGDVHVIQVMNNQDASQMATAEAQELGQLTNAGFKTVVASAWSQEDTKTAGLLYAAIWNENKTEVLLRYGDQIESSEELFSAISVGDLTAAKLLDLCRSSKL